MGYKVFVSMNIAVIGTGKIAESYALAFAEAGHDVYMAWKDNSNVIPNPMLETLMGVHFCSIEEAAEVADMIVIATSPRDVREVSYWLGDVRTKVIVDLTSNTFAASDEQVKTVCAIQAITGSQHIVKAFHTRGYEQLLKPLFKGEAVELILVGDSKKAKEVVKIMALDFGITHCYDFGGTETIPLFNAMTSSWRTLVQDLKAAQADRSKTSVLK